MSKAFPVLYVKDIARAQEFYAALGFDERYRNPEVGEAAYVSLALGDSQLGLAIHEAPRDLIGVEVGSEPRGEMWVYVDDVDGTCARLATGGSRVLREAEDMPWGERVAWVTDPDGNPVALASA